MCGILLLVTINIANYPPLRMPRGKPMPEQLNKVQPNPKTKELA
jgi:hypothetical protein